MTAAVSVALRFLVFLQSKEDSALGIALKGCNPANFTSGFTRLMESRSKFTGRSRAYVYTYLTVTALGVALVTTGFLVMQRG